MMKTIWKSKGSRIWLIVTCVLLVLMIAVNIVATQVLLVSKTLDQVFGGPVAKATGNGQVLYTTSSAGDKLEYYDASSGIQVFVDEASGAAGTADRHIKAEGNTLTVPEGYMWVATEVDGIYELMKAPEGYHIIVTDYTKGLATTSLNAETLYKGEVSFTVAADEICKVGLVNADGTITALSCTTVDDVHTFTVTVSDADVNLVIVIRGDFDLNGSMENKDATFIKQVLVGNRTMEEATAKVQEFAGDVDDNGKLQTKDATFISQALVGLRSFSW